LTKTNAYDKIISETLQNILALRMSESYEVLKDYKARFMNSKSKEESYLILEKLRELEEYHNSLSNVWEFECKN
jgi:hypothetical protein